MRLLNFCNKVIEYSFYLLFFLVPLAFTNDTSELFEFNKLWVTFIITLVIAAAWTTKIVIKRQLRIQKTPLDIPIVLFLASEIISTFLSLDPHTSIWGYYSRFNGGLLSIISYIFLYYAFVSNLKEEETEEKVKLGLKKVYIFIIGVVAFFIGALVSSQIKSSQSADIPYQLLMNLLTVFVSFAILMKAAPQGIIKRSIFAILSSCLLVVLWGLPSHFGYDPTCLLFRGTFDVSCWTNEFQPKVRIFSTLGQPDWMAAYLAALIPLIGALFINSVSESKIIFSKSLSFFKDKNFIISASLFIFFVITYLALLYTVSRSAVLAIWLSILLFLVWFFWFYIKPRFDLKKLNLDFKTAILLFVSVGVITFFAGQPFGQLNKFSFSYLTSLFARPPTSTKTVAKPAAVAPVTLPPGSSGELGGTDSGKIRLLVWDGAIDIWKHNLLFGSGLETYAYAYYQYRPAAHNLTSEWKYLYNKAHNEYLNYLATTGTVGIVTYLLMIGSFLFLSLHYLLKKRSRLSRKDLIIVSLLAGYCTILVTNFLGFSVVMINILFYLFPAFIFILAGKINYNKAYSLPSFAKDVYVLSKLQKALIVIAVVVSLYLIYVLVNFWNADRNYYYGMNYDQAGDYQQAYPYLRQAVTLRPSEPTFKDESSYNNAVLGASLLVQAQKQPQDQQQQAQTVAKQLIDTAIGYSNEVTSTHPNDIVFWKTRVRVFYTLGQLDPSYLPLALEAIKKAAELAPTDADVSYNLGVLYGQNGDIKDAVNTLENTIRLKSDYSNAYYALGIFYHQLALNSSGKVVDQSYNQKGIAEMKLLIKYFGPNKNASDAIAAWGGGK